MRQMPGGHEVDSALNWHEEEIDGVYAAHPPVPHDVPKPKWNADEPTGAEEPTPRWQKESRDVVSYVHLVNHF